VICAGDVGQAGKPVPTGTKICNDVTTGDLALGTDFSTPATSDELVEVYTSHGVTNVHEAATFTSGAAVLHSNSPTQEAIVTPLSWIRGTPPSDVVVVVDFVAPSAGSTLGVAPRCTADSCIVVEVDADGKYRFGNRQGSSWTYSLAGDLNQDTGYTAPRLDPTGENRLIVWLSNDTMGATLNARLLGTEQVKAPAPKQAFFFYRSVKAGSVDQVTLTRIYFFATSQ
jgi:hypothetical protein